MTFLAHIAPRRRTRIASAVQCVGAMLILVLGSHVAASANGTQAAEVKRQPVKYLMGSNCEGPASACQITMTTTPPGLKKRLHVAGLTCQAKVNSGAVVDMQIEGYGHKVYEYLRPEFGGAHNGKRLYFASSSTRYVMERDDEIKVQAVATADMINLGCVLLGELVTYQ